MRWELGIVSKYIEINGLSGYDFHIILYEKCSVNPKKCFQFKVRTACDLQMSFVDKIDQRTSLFRFLECVRCDRISSYPESVDDLSALIVLTKHEKVNEKAFFSCAPDLN